MLVALALWGWWPQEVEPKPLPIPTTSPAAAVKMVAPALRLHKPPARPPEALPQLPQRDALLAAVRERSATLHDCALPGDSLARLPLRLHLRKSGAMRAVDFTGEPPPARVATCVKKAAMKWSFETIPLQTDTELLVAISFTP